MYPLKKITPLILPKDLYTDRFDQPNAFVDMNPSMYIASDGSVTLLVRRVNYRKYADKTFSMGKYPSKSKYVIVEGHISDLGRLQVTPMRINYGQATYDTYWTGPEDIRFVDEHTIIATIPECNPTGQPAIFQGYLDGAKMLTYVEPCSPRETEKNWMPYVDQFGDNRVIYSLSPFLIKSVKAADAEELPIQLPELSGYHGSTNGVRRGESRLFLVHVNRERTYHRWLLFNPAKKTAKVSGEFVFFQHSYIEFPVSLCEYGGSLYVSLGVNDEAAMILEVDPPVF